MKSIFFFFAFQLFVGSALAQDGDSILNLKLNTIDKKTYSFSEIKNFDATIYIFLLTDCPASQNYTLTINNLQKKYAGKNVKFNIVFPDTYSSDSDIIKFKQDYKLNVSIILDPEMIFAKMIHATIAPQCFVFNKKGKIAYEGRIDDWYYSPGKKRTVIRSNDLDNTLANMLSGKPVNPAKTKAIGCVINY